MGCCCGRQPLGDRQCQAGEAPNPACVGSEAQKIPGGAQSAGMGGGVKPPPAPNTHQEHPEAGSEDAPGENLLEETQMRAKSKAALLPEPCERGAGAWITANQSPLLSELVPAKFPALSHHLPDGLQHLGLVLCCPPGGHPTFLGYASKEGESNGCTPKPTPSPSSWEAHEKFQQNHAPDAGAKPSPIHLWLQGAPGTFGGSVPTCGCPHSPARAGAATSTTPPRAESEPETFSRPNSQGEKCAFFFSIRSKPLCRGFGRKQM